MQNSNENNKKNKINNKNNIIKKNEKKIFINVLFLGKFQIVAIDFGYYTI